VHSISRTAEDKLLGKGESDPAGKMRTYIEYGAKLLSLALTYILIFGLAALPVQAQNLPTELRIVVLQGEGATTDIRQPTSSEPIIRVDDEKHNPVSGAVAVFTLPTEGATGEFAKGSKTLAVTTDNRGQAAASGLRMNSTPGKVPIFVSVSYRGLSAKTVMTQFSVAPPGAKVGGGSGGHGKLIAILAILGAGAAGGVVAATHKSGSPTSVTTPPSGTTPIGITIGTGSIAPPH
jgi:hypothetical protein